MGEFVMPIVTMPESKKTRKSAWLWPLGILAAGVTGVAAVAVRGCWHKSMSWPVRAGRHSYQVCTACGVKRLFDEHTFRGYGPYSYELAELVEISQAENDSVEEPATDRTDKKRATTVLGPQAVVR